MRMKRLVLAGVACWLCWTTLLSGADSGERLTCRPRPAPQALKPLAVGEEIQTATGQRRRVGLPDGSLLLVNEQTTVKITAARRLTVSNGAIQVEVAPAAEKSEKEFVVKTPHREVTAVGTSFAVQVTRAGTGVLVARGTVKVSEVANALHAGQQLPIGTNKPQPAGNLAHLLGWTRDLRVAAEAPLVPESKHAGGSLIAVDPAGEQAKLSLRRYHVDVVIEDGFARTTVDQTYFNHHTSRLEGTFYFPLPPDASLSHLAMYVGGDLMEGGIVERDYGRSVYERIVTSQRDPALLEWLDGSTFKMRVFPLEARQEKRIILSYTQQLSTMLGQGQYRFPVGHSLGTVAEWSLQLRLKNAGGGEWKSPSHTLQAKSEKNDLLLSGSGRNVRLDRDVVVEWTESTQQQQTARFSVAELDGAKYLLVRYRPTLEGPPQRERRDWVFLFESSGDRNPLLARTQVEIIRGLLASAEPEDTFAVVVAGTETRSLAEQMQPVTPQNVQAAISYLEGAHLIGALDLGRALNEVGTLLKGAKNPYLVHVGSGIPAMGEKRLEVLSKRLPEGARYVGIGVGRRWNRALMKATAEHTGGYFTQINPDEPTSWRTFEVASTLNTPRLLNLKVTDPSGKVRFLSTTTMLAQGQELCACARLIGTQDLPASVAISGASQGQPYEETIKIAEVASRADYLPRHWARLEIERLLAEDASKHRAEIIQLAKAMYLVTPFTSLLVLENEDMYQQFHVERNRKDAWAPYPAPKKIKVVYEPLEGTDPDPKSGTKPTRQQVLNTILVRGMPPFFQPLDEEDQKRLYERQSIPWSGAFRAARSTEKKEPESYALEHLAATTPVSGEALTELGLLLQSDPVHSITPAWNSPVFSTDGVRLTSAERAVSVSGKVPREERREGLRGLQGLLDAEERAPLAPMTLGDFAGVTEASGDLRSLQELRKHRRLSESGAALRVLNARPRFQPSDRFFFDLVGYAPGLNTSRADIQAVIEAEAVPSAASRRGTIDDGVKELFQRARSGNWQALSIPARGENPGFTVVFDGQGRHAYQRTIRPGIREQVICDGQTLWHLYPELGLGAKRTVSRFHRIHLQDLLPGFLPTPEDLAHGADLRKIDEHTVALIPHDAEGRKDEKGKPIPYAVLHLRFADKGRLAERLLLSMPAKKVVQRQVCAADGSFRILDGEGKELQVRKSSLAQGKIPELKPQTKELVVLPLPYRTRAHVLQARKLDRTGLNEMRFEDGLHLLGAALAANNANELLQVVRSVFLQRDQEQIGFYVLLAAVGHNLDSQNLDVLKNHLRSPLAQYLALHSSPVLRQHAAQWAVGVDQWNAGFLQHLALTHALLQRWQNGRAMETASSAQREQELQRAVDYIQRHKGTRFGWALLTVMQERIESLERGKNAIKNGQKTLAELWPLFTTMPGMETVARYEQARALWKSGQKKEAQQRFVKLYQEALAQGGLLAIDGDFRSALLASGADRGTTWSQVLNETARELIQKKRRQGVLTLVEQCWQLDDQPLAGELLQIALADVHDAQELQGMRLLALDFYLRTSQLESADQMLRTLLQGAEAAKNANLWYLAAELAEKRDMPERRLECLEKALDLDFHSVADVVNLEEVRKHYGNLLDRYQELTTAMRTLKVQAPPEFLSKVLRTADRWRALDPEGSERACTQAAQILERFGEKKLAWDYLTTPIALHPGEAQPWYALGQQLQRKGDLVLADRAYQAACESEPTNAQMVWDRAMNLRQAGKTVEARRVLQQLAEGTWQPRFQHLKDQARSQLDK